MPMYSVITDMTRGFYCKCFVIADSIEQAREAAERRIDSANAHSFKVDTVTKVDSAAAMQEARAKGIEIMNAQPSTSATTAHDTDHTNAQTEPDTSSPATASGKAEQDTRADNGKRNGHAPRATTAPQSVEEARQRIQYLYLPDVSGTPARHYHAAVMEMISGEPWTEAPYIASALAYGAGIMEGKRQERQRRRAKATTNG